MNLCISFILQVEYVFLWHWNLYLSDSVGHISLVLLSYFTAADLQSSLPDKGSPNGSVTPLYSCDLQVEYVFPWFWNLYLFDSVDHIYLVLLSYFTAEDLQSSLPDKGSPNRSVTPGWWLSSSSRSSLRLLRGHSGQGHWVRLLRTTSVNTQLLTIIPTSPPHLVTEEFFSKT